MDNAIDALKIAFCVLVFIIALSVCMNAFANAKEVTDHVFYRLDKTNYYEYTDTFNVNREGRIVSGETILPTLYRYYKENFNVRIVNKQGIEIATFNLENEIKSYNKNYKNAPWLGNANIDTKKRVDIEISGKEDKINGVKYNPQVEGGLLEYTQNKQFIETFSEDRFSGKEVTVVTNENGENEIVYVDNITENADGTSNYERIIIPDAETLELVKGNTKITITYTET